MIKKYVILSAALFAAAMLVVYCTEFVPNNPIDEKGSDCKACEKARSMAEEWAKDSSKRDPSILAAMVKYGYDTTYCKKPCQDNPTSAEIYRFVIDHWYDTTHFGGAPLNSKWACDMAAPKITLASYGTVELEFDPLLVAAKYQGDVRKLEELLLRPGYDQKSALTVEWGEATSQNVTAILVDGSNKEVTYNLNEGMPRPRPGEEQQGSIFNILYRAVKISNCGDESYDEKTREIRIREYVTEDIVLPTITLTSPQPENIFIEKTVISDYGATATNGRGGSLTNEITKVVLNEGRSTVGTDISAIDNSTPGTWYIKYTVCKELRYGDNSTKDTCVSVERTIKIIKDEGGGGDPQPFIVLHPYKFEIDDKIYELRDTTVKTGGSFKVPGSGDVKEVYYYDKDGVKKTIPTDRVTAGNNPSIPSGGDPKQVDNKTYTLEAREGEYKSASVSRSVYVTNVAPCNEVEPIDHDPPSITLRNPTSGNVEIPANVAWEDTDIASRWGASARDGSETAWKLGVHFGSLDRFRPQSSEYTITLVALGGCGYYTTRDRTVVVK